MNADAPQTRIENTLARAHCRCCGVTVALRLIRDGREPVLLCGFCHEPLGMPGGGAALARPAVRGPLATR
ncbi:MAG: hypothetical protein FJ388_19045 [Verrucomicrobia bacterium]|nr:hypothetical protein [Verrucomicrobiota bacterium]